MLRSFVAALLFAIWLSAGVHLAVGVERRLQLGPKRLLKMGDQIHILADPKLLSVSLADGAVYEVDLERGGAFPPFQDLNIDAETKDAWVVEQDRPTLARVTMDGDPVINFPLQPKGARRAGAKMSIALSGKLLYASDSSGLIRRFDRKGREQTPLGKGLLRKPARIAFGPDQRLWVADFGHRRIAVLDLNGVLHAEIQLNQRPIAFAFLESHELFELFVLTQNKEVLRVKLAPQAKVHARFQLSADVVPSDILVHEGALLISDLAGARVLRLSFEGERLGFFGRQALAARQGAMLATKALRLAAQAVLLLSFLGLLAALFGRLKAALKDRNPPQSSDSP